MLSTEEWMQKEIERADKAFANHEMKVVGPGHWNLRNSNPKERAYFWTDIVVMGGVGLAVWGDIEGCFFSYYSGARRPEDLVAWMAHADANSYGREKAVIGMGGSNEIDAYVAEVGIYDLAQMFNQKEEEYDSQEWIEQRPGVDAPSLKEIYYETFDEATKMFARGDHIRFIQDYILDELQKVEPDAYEWVYSIGRVTSCRVIYALAAVRRLWELIQEQWAKENDTEEELVEVNDTPG